MKRFLTAISLLLTITGWSQTITLVSPTPVYWGMDSLRINVEPEASVTFTVSSMPSVLYATDDSTFTVRKPLGDLTGQNNVVYTLRKTFEGKTVMRYSSKAPSNATTVHPTQLPWNFPATWAYAEVITPLDTTPVAEIDSAFEKLLVEVQSKEREFERLQLSKNYIKEHKVSTANAKRLVEKLGFENTRFEFLMLVVEHCTDPENLPDLATELSFEPTKNSYLERVKERAERTQE